MDFLTVGLRRLSLMVLSLALAGWPLFSQSVYGSIVGTVSDTSGASITNAEVTLLNSGTNERRTAQTDSGGHYQFVNLVPGRYQVEVVQSGFKRLTRRDILVEVQSTVRIDAALQVGEMGQVVEVKAESPMLQPETSSLGHVVQSRAVQQMPLNGRNVLNLVALAPGVIPNGQSMGNPAIKSGHARALAAASVGSRGEWAFGAGTKAITWVSRVDGESYVEHGLSDFPPAKTTGLTPGHHDQGGRRYRTLDPQATVLRCFRCPTTGPLLLGDGGRVTPAELGVGCESCHGPGAAHIKAGGGRGHLFQPRALAPAALNDYCGACHRKAEDIADWSKSWNVRHQPA